MQIAPAARGIARTVVDFAPPPRCSGCGEIVTEQHSFCLPCWQSLTFLGEPCCECCGLPFEYDAGEDVRCGRCMTEPPNFDRLRAAVAYGKTARQIALKLKYGGRPAAAETLARFMARHVSDADPGTVLIPVPLHRWRIWRRGYNQSALVGRALSKRTGLRLELDLLRRIKATPPLKGMGGKERAATMRGAFALAPGRKGEVKGGSFTLVDDVFTSGATANACAGILKRAGAARVEIICWARVLPGKDD